MSDQVTLIDLSAWHSCVHTTIYLLLKCNFTGYITTALQQKINTLRILYTVESKSLSPPLHSPVNMYLRAFIHSLVLMVKAVWFSSALRITLFSFWTRVTSHHFSDVTTEHQLLCSRTLHFSLAVLFLSAADSTKVRTVLHHCYAANRDRCREQARC